MKEVVDKCIEYSGRKNTQPNFAITGGDPLLNPDFGKLAEYLRDNEINFHMMGNPFHLT